MLGSRLFLSFFRCAGKDCHAKCRKLQCDGILSLITLSLLRCFNSRIYYTITTVLFIITVKDFFIFAGKRNSHIVVFIWDCREIADSQNSFFRFLCLSHECDHILLILHQLNPFKSIVFIIQLIKCRMSKIHIIEVFDKYFQFFRHIFIRCHHLASRMKHHIGISLSDLRILLFLTSRQLICEILQCTNIPAAKRQNIMFTVCIEHGHGQLIMVILSLNRILAQIFKQIFCPSATPFIVKSQMVILHTVCQLRPESVLLSN